MAKAELNLPSGGHVKITGTPQEIASFLNLYSSGDFSEKKRSRPKRSTGSKGKLPRKSGPVILVKELIEGGYFKGQKRTLPEIQKKLEERGHIYAQTSLSPALLGLTKRKHLRRIKEKKGWVYVV